MIVNIVLYTNNKINLTTLSVKSNNEQAFRIETYILSQKLKGIT